VLKAVAAFSRKINRMAPFCIPVLIYETTLAFQEHLKKYSEHTMQIRLTFTNC